MWMKEFENSKLGSKFFNFQFAVYFRVQLPTVHCRTLKIFAITIPKKSLWKVKFISNKKIDLRIYIDPILEILMIVSSNNLIKIEPALYT